MAVKPHIVEPRPGEESPLTEEQQAEIARQLTPHLIACPVCRHSDFVIADEIYAPPRLRLNASFDFGTAFPLVLVSCQTCGFVLPFNARQLGFFTPEKAK